MEGRPSSELTKVVPLVAPSSSLPAVLAAASEVAVDVGAVAVELSVNGGTAVAVVVLSSSAEVTTSDEVVAGSPFAVVTVEFVSSPPGRAVVVLPSVVRVTGVEVSATVVSVEGVAGVRSSDVKAAVPVATAAVVVTAGAVVSPSSSMPAVALPSAEVLVIVRVVAAAATEVSPAEDASVGAVVVAVVVVVVPLDASLSVCAVVVFSAAVTAEEDCDEVPASVALVTASVTSFSDTVVEVVAVSDGTSSDAGVVETTVVAALVVVTVVSVVVVVDAFTCDVAAVVGTLVVDEDDEEVLPIVLSRTVVPRSVVVDVPSYDAVVKRGVPAAVVVVMVPPAEVILAVPTDVDVVVAFGLGRSGSGVIVNDCCRRRTVYREGPPLPDTDTRQLAKDTPKPLTTRVGAGDSSGGASDAAVPGTRPN